jgi:hypothetical protein
MDLHDQFFGHKHYNYCIQSIRRHDSSISNPEMQTTVSLKKVSCGTELNVVQEGIPSAIPLEACHLAWQDSLTLLAQLVEAEIPG